MQINEVIRKYRKAKNMTQEEMANRLGVSAPAVNKWESGASMPDITLLAPIARLLGISLDELLSYNENLSDIEVQNIIAEIYGMFDRESVGTVFQKMVDTVRKYPNAETLILSLASLLYSRCLILSDEDREEYDRWIQSCYENLLSSEDESMRMRAADGLYALYIRRRQYEEAEKCLEFYSIQNPERKRKLAAIYCGSGRYEEAYKTLEELLFSDYQVLSTAFHQIYTVAVETKDYEKARAIVEKESALAELFEMGEYHQIAGRLDFAVAMKNADQALEIMDSLLSHTDTLTDYTKSSLYEHMTFRAVDPLFQERMIDTMLKQFLEDDACQFIRESSGWEKFRTKWC